MSLDTLTGSIEPTQSTSPYLRQPLVPLAERLRDEIALVGADFTLAIERDDLTKALAAVKRNLMLVDLLIRAEGAP